jgi:hypothetical protein
MHRVSPESPSLRDLQDRFLRDLADRDGPAGESVAALFEDPPRGGFENRRAVYRSGYVARIAEALENDFRAVRRILGEGPFLAMARRYVAAAPPASFDLGVVGDRLPGFLTDDRLAGRLPFLPALARLELAQAKAFVARDSVPLDWGDLARRGAEAAADTILRLHPGTAVIHSAWPLDDIQACRDLPDEQVSIDLEGRPVTLLVYRRAFDVLTRRIDPDETRVIEIFERGATLASFPDALQCGDNPACLNRFLGLFRRLVGDGVFSNSGAPHDAAAPQRKESP